jgi:hypothetical protein
MKNFLAIVLCLVAVLSVFVACSKSNDDSTETTTQSSTIETEDASIKSNDALNLVKSYTADELGMSKSDYKNCEFLIKQIGVVIDGEKYVQVSAQIMKKETVTNANGENVEQYRGTEVGNYYISFDGTKIMRENAIGTYDDMEMKPIPTDDSTDSTTQPAETDTTK